LAWIAELEDPLTSEEFARGLSDVRDMAGVTRGREDDIIMS
jgi:hypothetical protein